MGCRTAGTNPQAWLHTAALGQQLPSGSLHMLMMRGWVFEKGIPDYTCLPYLTDWEPLPGTPLTQSPNYGNPQQVTRP